MSKVFLLIWLVYCPAVLAIEGSTVSQLKDVVEKTIINTGFNGSVLVSKNGVVVFRKNIGFADPDRKTPISPKHLFSPGSVGKEFTTISIMQLVEQGKLGYEDNIAKYLAEFPSWAKKITVEHILAHTSGLPKIKWKRNIDTSDAADQIKNSSLAFEPGNDYLYSNLNVVIRALIVEKITGDVYYKFAKKFIFEVAGMTDSYQQIDANNFSKMIVTGDYPTALNGATIYVTPLDLLKFEIALRNSSLLPIERIVKALPGDKLSGKSNRAYFDFGKYFNDIDGNLVSWEHDGSNPSHHTIKHSDFKNDYTIILMSSDGNKSTLYKIRDALKNNLSKNKSADT
ncbi:serine hydrolase domain-containing protein [Microbulbifer sp. 2304DJ12-6]|uniref:serine hydrolase domain-containing protein n=1 Tax=Microbulbifer sp. 2304DJ12-6 TaxID=3233340 RepID=UPI0039AE9BAA